MKRKNFSMALILIFLTSSLLGCNSASKKELSKITTPEDGISTTEMPNQSSSDKKNTPETVKTPTTPVTPTTPTTPATPITPVKTPVSPVPAPSANSTTEAAKTSNNYIASTASSNPAIPIKYSYEFLTAVENRVLELCNGERSKLKLSNLSMNEKLRDISKYKAQEMLQYNYFSHVSAVSGKDPFKLITSFNYVYTASGENIQMSQGMSKANVTADYIFTNWMNSPGHKANILNLNFKQMGIGVVFSTSGNKAYESQMFSN